MTQRKEDDMDLILAELPKETMECFLWVALALGLIVGILVGVLRRE